MIDAYQPTLLVDEADTFLTRSAKNAIHGILNAGHTRTSASVFRIAGKPPAPRIFSTWCPKAIALIGTLPTTLADRAITLPLARKRPSEHVDKLHDLSLPEQYTMQKLRDQLERWAADHQTEIAQAGPEFPEGLHDRARDNWAPLLAIAECAGSDWPARARAAALALTPNEVDEETPGVQLLADVHDYFLMHNVDRVASRTLLDWLLQLEDRPWARYYRGSALTTHQLARLLKPYGVRSRQLWLPVGGRNKNVHGYRLEDFQDVFQR